MHVYIYIYIYTHIHASKGTLRKIGPYSVVAGKQSVEEYQDLSKRGAVETGCSDLYDVI